jgi:hypothetical protein
MPGVTGVVLDWMRQCMPSNFAIWGEASCLVVQWDFATGGQASCLVKVGVVLDGTMRQCMPSNLATGGQASCLVKVGVVLDGTMRQCMPSNWGFCKTFENTRGNQSRNIIDTERDTELREATQYCVIHTQFESHFNRNFQ